MAYSKNFEGTTGFFWFTGVVEDRQDPQKLGRHRVRCFGFHNENKEILPTKDLPWATVSLPVTSPAISGLGQSPSFLVEGTWCWGYFRDGIGCQEPVICGTIPGKPSTLADANASFNDPNGIYPRHLEVDTNRLAVNDSENEHITLATRRADRVLNVPTADFDPIRSADNSQLKASDQTFWSVPELPYAAVYPYNHVYESESGHLLEFDDTANAERVHIYHKTGTNIELYPDGDRVDVVKKDYYNIVAGKSQAQITGNSDITISGRHKIYVNRDGGADNHYDIHVGANANINIQVDNGNINMVTKTGKINMNAGGDYNLKVGGNYTVTVLGNTQETIAGNKTSETTGAVVHKGKTIDLNP